MVAVLVIGVSALARAGTALSEAASHEQQTGWVTTGSSNSESQPAMVRSAAISSTGSFTAYLPYVSRSAPELHGMVTFRGEPVSDVTITLNKCCYPFSPGIGSIRIQTTTTDAGGMYNFTGVPSLTSDEDKVYFAQYADVTADPSRLCKWTTARLSTYETGSTVSLRTFDISNVTLIEPEAGIATSPPITFRWVPRATVLSDTGHWRKSTLTDLAT
jgi:hypothetical protein